MLRLRSGFVFLLRDEAWSGCGLLGVVALALWLARRAFLGVWRLVALCTARHFLVSGRERVTKEKGALAWALLRARRAFLGIWRLIAPCTARHFLLSGQEKVTKEKATPTSEFRCAKLPSLRCRSGGRLTRAVVAL